MSLQQAMIKMRQKTENFGHRLFDWIAPPACATCGQPLENHKDTLCPMCWQKFQDNLSKSYCPVCGHDTGPYALIDDRCYRCQNRHPHVSQMTRVGDYSGTLRELILGFKFKRQSHLDRFLGSLIASAILGSPALEDVDFFIPIPLHWRRRWTRRYNQADLLLQAAADELNQSGRSISINRDLLRIRYTQPQTSLAVSHRLRNLHGAFACRPDAPYQGKHLCLIDDVTTTGTTLRVAAATCKKAGAAQISAVVLAVAAND